MAANAGINEFGDMGYAVVDVEALLLGPRVRVVEQVGYVLRSATTGAELLAEKFIVYQPHGVDALVANYSQPRSVVDQAVAAYCRITGDPSPVHDDPGLHPSWAAVKYHINRVLKARAFKVYAKGADLERRVFGTLFAIHELELFGCPKYPGAIHDPLEECRFFSRYIPELPEPGRTPPASMFIPAYGTNPYMR